MPASAPDAARDQNQTRTSLKQLQETSIGDLLQKIPEKKLISVPDTLPLDDFLGLLSRNDILAVPVFGSDGQPKAILGVLDIVEYLVFAVCDEIEKTNKITPTAMDRLKSPISAVLESLDNSSEAFTLWKYGLEEKLGKVLDVLSKGVHRVLIGNVRILTQSDILKYAFPREPNFPESFLDSSLEQLGLYPSKSFGVDRPIVSAPDDLTALRAFKVMALNSVTALPIVENKNGSIVGTISVSDLRGLHALKLPDLLLPVGEYLKKHKPPRSHPNQLTATPQSTLRQAVTSFVDARVHHVWVLDQSHRPVGCVTLTDVMSKLSPFDYLK